VLFRSFGTDAVRGAAIVASTGSAGFDKLSESIGKISAADVAATRLDNMKGSTDQLMGSVETLAINIGSKILPVLQQMVDGLTQAVNWFGSLDEGTQNLIIASVAVAGGLLLVVGGTIKMIQIMQSAIATIKALELAKAASFLKDKAIAAGQLVVRAATLAGAAATAIATAAQWALNAALTANPIGIIIVAIAALVAGLIFFFTQTELGRTIWQGFVDFLVSAWVWLQQAAANTWNAIMMAIGAVVAWFQTYVLPVIQFVIDAIVLYFTIWYTVVSTVVTAIMTVIGAMVGWFMTYVAPLIQAFVDLAIAIFMFFWNTAAAIWQALVDAVSVLVTALVSFVVGKFNEWLAVVVAILTAIWNFIVSIWNAIVAFLQPIIQGVVTFITNVWNGIYTFVSALFGRILAVTTSIWNTIVGAISAFVSGVVNNIVSVWSGLVGTVRGIFDGIYNSVRDPIQRALDFVMGFKDKVISFFSGAGSWLMDAGGKIISGLKKGIENALGGLTDLLGGITKMIPLKKGPPAKDRVLLAPAGKMIMQGLINGLQSERGNLIDMLGGLNTTIPSSLTQEINANINGRSAGTDQAPIQINVEWHAAPNDKVDTRQQVMEMLGRATELFREELA